MDTPATILRNAAYAGDAILVSRLLREGVDPNIADERGRTALVHACGAGHIAVVDTLLANGAWVDLHEDYDVYDTPLMAAACAGRLEIVKKLVAAGANPHFHIGFAQRTVESYARNHGHNEVAEYLSKLPSP